MLDQWVHFLAQYGLFGMFAAAVLGGTVLPFPSEVVLVALVAAGVSPWKILFVAAVGNTLGCAFNYGLGRLGKESWMESLRRRKPEKYDKAKAQASRYGYWSGLLTGVPYFSYLLTILLGYFRVPFWRSMACILVSKTLRYLVIILIANGIL